MGADLIIQYILVREEKHDTKFFDRLQKAYIKKLDKLPDNAILLWGENVTGEIEEDVKEAKIKAIKMIDSIFCILKNNPRDVTFLTVPISKKKYYTAFVTGGMSWGDNPTDSCDYFYSFNELFNMYNYIDDILKEEK